MPQTIVIFGASGDLTSRKLIPALYELYRKRRLPEGTKVVGVSRTPFSDESWRAKLAESSVKFLGERFQQATWDAFAAGVHYQPGDILKPEDILSLLKRLDGLDGVGPSTRIFYLATAPESYQPAIAQLGSAGLARKDGRLTRIVVEKPFGRDLASARQLNTALHEVFAESQVYRIDHYLGKETVQNILVLRFANLIFEPIWNRNYIDHVEITAAEDLTVGHRAGYYDTAGVLRDMFQNHLLQLLTITSLEAPARFEADAVRDEKVKVLRSIRPLWPEDVANDTLRGQYRKYRDEPGVASGSETPTFGVVKLHIDNWRWQGVPFYLRSGKALSCATTQIVIQFRQPPHLMFDEARAGSVEGDRLLIQVQPAEGISLHFVTKVPDAGMQLRLTDLSFRFREKFAADIPDSYQRLLLDVMQGDPSLFARSDEVELAWSIIDPVATAWEQLSQPPLLLYEAGGWGPPTATAWIQRHGHEWFDACPVLH